MKLCNLVNWENPVQSAVAVLCVSFVVSFIMLYLWKPDWVKEKTAHGKELSYKMLAIISVVVAALASGGTYYYMTRNRTTKPPVLPGEQYGTSN